MSKRPAVTQAYVQRLIRAAKAEGVPVVRITATADSVSIETLDKGVPPPTANDALNGWRRKRSKEHARAG